MVSAVVKSSANPLNIVKKTVFQSNISMNNAPNGIRIPNLWYGIIFLSTIMIILHTITVVGSSYISSTNFVKNPHKHTFTRRKCFIQKETVI